MANGCIHRPKLNQVIRIQCYLKVIIEYQLIIFAFKIRIDFIANGKPEKVLDRVKEMKIEPDEYILGMIFHACAQVNNDEAKNIGIKLLDKMSERFHANPILLTTALKMLMSFGDINRAEKLFQSMKMPNVFNYGVMLKGKYQ